MMKFFRFLAILPFGLMPRSYGQMSESVAVMTDMLRAANNVESAILSYQLQHEKEQPICMHPTKNYIKCISVPDDIDKTTFVVHPIAPPDTTLESLRGTDDYEMAKSMIEAFRDAVNDCNKVGKYGLAIYRWLSGSNHETKITATSLVKDFQISDKDDSRIICGSGPIHENEVISFVAREEMDAAFQMMRGAQNLDKAIENFQLNIDDYQPTCSDPTSNYVKCMDLPDDINDTTFLVHPVAPAGVTLRMLDGTPDYEMAKRMILAFREALSGCDELGKYGLATYPWLSEKDHITKVGATSLVKDFSGPSDSGNDRPINHQELVKSKMDRFMCGTGPLTEEPIASDTFMAASSIMDATFNTLRAARQLDHAIQSFKLELKDEQPVCMHPNLNYITCITFPRDIMQTKFLVHPEISPGTEISSLKYKADYTWIRKMVESYRAAVRDCDEVENYGLATYPWQSEDDTAILSGVSLVKDFLAIESWGDRRLSGANQGFFRREEQMERYICGTGPLLETSVIDSLDLDFQEALLEEVQLDVEEVMTEETFSVMDKPTLEDVKPDIEGLVIDEIFNDAPQAKNIFPEKEFEMKFVEDTGATQEEVAMLEESGAIVKGTSSAFQVFNSCSIPSLISLALSFRIIYH